MAAYRLSGLSAKKLVSYRINTISISDSELNRLKGIS